MVPSLAIIVSVCTVVTAIITIIRFVEDHSKKKKSVSFEERGYIVAPPRYEPTPQGSDEILASQILEAVGGRTNVQKIASDNTWISFSVNNASLINDTRLKSLGVSSVIKHKNTIQVVMGTQSKSIAASVNYLLKRRNG